ncbi:MAG TPA: ArsC family reductase [Gammaproteobacteria bacterium]|nr:ArsC family reductase [Gammaproteobacteria bacterium]|tara:strand:- start:26 stop:367 length:342 start_codon:yes stop_codon:yes gene_type:complete
MLTVYGIKNCDTVKKARGWLDNHEVDYEFHDFRVDGLNADMVNQWTNDLGWETLVNCRSTTWRNLDDDTKDNLSADNVVALLLDNPTLIKRPVVQTSGAVLVGFKESEFEGLL